MSHSERGTVAVIGAGTIGRSWAIAFARAGWAVHLFDRTDAAQRAAASVAEEIELLRSHGLALPPGETGSVMALNTLACAVEGASIIQESIFEDLGAKRAVFDELEPLVGPDTLLASSTSAIVGSAFLGGRPSAGRAFVAHPANPPHLIPLVEICPTPETTDATVARARALYTAAGMTAVTVRREIDGFLLNRLQAAVIGEALALVAGGYASPQDLDLVMTRGLGRRWAFLGPFETSHLNHAGGYRGYMQMFAETYRRLTQGLKVGDEWPQGLFDRVADDLDTRIPTNRVADAQRWRDNRLMALNAHLSIMPGFVKSE